MTQTSPGPKHLDKLLALIKDYVVMSDEERLVVALWIVHTHAVQHFEQTPYLTVTSPERQCGKSRLLELLELVVARPWKAVLPSEAVVYRNIHKKVPTLLLDETDTIFNTKTADRFEGLRAILNAGHRAGNTVPRCLGQSSEPQDFNVYCAKVLAGIGTLPDTITDRAIPIRLQRKTRSEHVKRFRVREVKAEADPIREALENFGARYGEQLGLARPELPDELSDRMQEGIEPLLAIADAIGYGDEARTAMVTLLTSERADESDPARRRLLSDIRDLFANLSARAIFTEDLLLKLHENGWGNWFGHGLDANELASMLKHYGVRPKQVRVGSESKKGYHRADFEEAWSRYLPETGETDEAANPDSNGSVSAVSAIEEDKEQGSREGDLSLVVGETAETTETSPDLIDMYVRGELGGRRA